MDRDDILRGPVQVGSKAKWAVFLAIGSILAAGAFAFFAFSPRKEPAPPEIAGDPLLSRGREIYLDRCASCHGPGGRGDGPLAKGLTGPPPRNLVQDPWKHGDQPEQVVKVIGEGVKDAQMPGWSGTFGPEDLKAVAAYVYQVAGKPVPDPLRKP